MRIPAREYVGKIVVSESGKKFGIVDDLVIDKKTGELVFLVLRDPSPYLDQLNLEKDVDGKYLLPFTAVRSVGDFIVVDEKEL